MTTSTQIRLPRKEAYGENREEKNNYNVFVNIEDDEIFEQGGGKNYLFLFIILKEECINNTLEVIILLLAKQGRKRIH